MTATMRISAKLGDRYPDNAKQYGKLYKYSKPRHNVRQERDWWTVEKQCKAYAEWMIAHGKTVCHIWQESNVDVRSPMRRYMPDVMFAFYTEECTESHDSPAITTECRASA